MDIFLQVLEWVAGLGALGWFIWWRLHRSDAEAGTNIAKFVATGVILFAIVRHVFPLAASGMALVGVPLLAGCMILLSILWQHEIIGIFADPLGDMIDGGKERIEAKPFYSHAEAKRMAGDIPGAIADVRAELEKFPNDYDGRMRLAALLAEHSEDLPGAIAVIEEALQLKDLTDAQISYALKTAADWHLKFGRDSESARLAIERITTLLPGTQSALHAQQRLTNHTSQAMLAHEDDHSPVVMPEFQRKLGMRRKKPVAAVKPDINAAERLLRDRLAKNKNDWTAREELARLYVEEFEFFDRGLQELEILISTPGQPKSEVVRWLHQKADWQAKMLDNVEAGRVTLKRIQELFPNSAAAHRAAVAIMHLQPVSKVEKKQAEE